MTVLDDVGAPITRLSLAPICDDYAAEKLNLSVRQQANQKPGRLRAATERRRDICSRYVGEKRVTRRV